MPYATGLAMALETLTGAGISLEGIDIGDTSLAQFVNVDPFDFKDSVTLTEGDASNYLDGRNGEYPIVLMQKISAAAY